MSRDHRNLRAFQLADAFAVAVYGATRNFPREELFGLTSQLRRAAVSSAANIVEGCARSTERDFVHFLTMALGSLREAGYYVDLACRLGYLDATLSETLTQQYEEAARVLSGLLRTLKQLPRKSEAVT